jgi:hypothetical protein
MKNYNFKKGSITTKRGQYSFEVECGKHIMYVQRNVIMKLKEGIFLLKNKWKSYLFLN